MIIGEDIDFSTVKQGLEQKLNAINLESCKPTGYVSTKESGIFHHIVTDAKRLLIIKI